MSNPNDLKQWFLRNLPFSVKKQLSVIPYALRLGMPYVRSGADMRRHEVLDDAALELYITDKLRWILNNAVKNITFYRDFYRQKGFDTNDFRSLEDWRHVPIITKADLIDIPISRRTANDLNGVEVNTGGTSGAPLAFRVDSGALGREWAHMHSIWFAKGYRPSHLKLRFTGKYFDSEQALHYHPSFNEYIVNANSSMPDVATALANLPIKNMPRWIHGYPSLIAEFAHTIKLEYPQIVKVLKTHLYGVLLGSEYPAPVYREAINEILTTNIVSWYGHSEMAILAKETSPNVYESLGSYGYAEAISCDEDESHRLICTSFHNAIHPFIRYDTGDLIKPLSSLRGSLKFQILEGRIGDFILDLNGRKLALTSIIFGRHHAAFKSLRHLQVRQVAPGVICLLIVPLSGAIVKADILEGFDFEGLNVEWRVEIVDKPIRTKIGKIQLKVA